MPAPPSRSQQATMASNRAALASSSRGISTPTASGSPTNNPTGISRSSSRATTTSNSRTSTGSGTTGRDDRQPSAGTSASPNNARTSSGSGRQGISTPTAAGSPRNNPTQINTKNSVQDFRNRVVQGAAANRISANAAQLAAQHQQYRSPNDFPFAGAEDLTRDEFNRVQSGADIRPQNFGFAAPSRFRSVKDQSRLPQEITSPINYGERLQNALVQQQASIKALNAARANPDYADLSPQDEAPDIRPQNYGFQAPPSRPRSIAGIPANVRPQNYGFQSPPEAAPHTPEGPADMFGHGYGIDPLADPNRFTYGTKARSKASVLTGVHPDALSKMMEAQSIFGGPLRVTSGFRNPFRNKKAGGVGGSQHMQGKALDFAINDTVGEDTARLISAMKQAGFTGVGGYRPGKVHGDIGDDPRTRPGVWGPDTHASSIGQLPKSMQQALLGKPTVMAAADIPIPRQKPTVMRNIVKPGINAIKGFLAPQAPIPIPRQKPMIPSTVAPATGIPRPQMKPMYPSTVAPATRIPIPRQKPAQTQVAYAEPTIVPAGGPAPTSPYRPRGVMKNGELIRDGVPVTMDQLIKPKAPAPPASSWSNMLGFDKLKTTYNNVNENVLKPIAQGVETYGQDATQRYVNAKIAAARNKQTRPTRYAQYGNMNRRRRQPIKMGYA